jgi:hypothetical protein
MGLNIGLKTIFPLTSEFFPQYEIIYLSCTISSPLAFILPSKLQVFLHLSSSFSLVSTFPFPGSLLIFIP